MHELEAGGGDTLLYNGLFSEAERVHLGGEGKMESMIFLAVIGLAAALFIFYKIRKSFKKADCGSCCGSCGGSCKKG